MKLKLIAGTAVLATLLACGGTGKKSTPTPTPAATTASVKPTAPRSATASSPQAKPYITEEDDNVVEDSNTSGFITPGAYCAAKLLNKTGKAANGMTYTCKAPKPYRWR